MCGIAGIYNLNKRAVDLAQVKAMTDSIVHRGPDAEGHWLSVEGNLALGHRRLSILDLSENGKQPMHFDDRFTITFNGEIYNYLELKSELRAKGYTFKTETDTEVLLALYHLKKEKCLDDLDGMFAFAIWDEKEKELFCARDRFGEKPFFYHYEPGVQFSFASEMKAIFSLGVKKKVSDEMLINYLVYSDVTNPARPEQTFYDSIKRLPHSHYLKISLEKPIEIRQYWDISTFGTASPTSIENEMETFRELLTNSVKLRLRSDVPIGSCLSGGLDSSIIVSIINDIFKQEKIHSKQKTFSVVFPGFELDEERYVRILEKEKDLDTHFTTPGKNFFNENLEKIFYHQEEPFPSSSIIAQYSVMQLAKNSNTTVLLDGQGADEILGGYHWYYRIYLQELLKRSRSEYRRELQTSKVNFNADLKFYLNTYFPNQYRKLSARRYEKHIKNGSYTSLVQELSASGPTAKALNKEYLMEHRDLIHYKESYPPSLNHVLHADAMHNWLQSLLRYADRNSMAFSREVRLPFLSHKLVEYIFSLSSSHKIHEGWTKYLMRRSFEKMLPKEIIWRTDKIGFAAPQKDWLKDFNTEDLYNNSSVKTIFQKQEGNTIPAVWQMLMIENTFKNIL